MRAGLSPASRPLHDVDALLGAARADDTAGADAPAQALVHLSDPNALAAMTAEEKARVVNFRIQ